LSFWLLSFLHGRHDLAHGHRHFYMAVVVLPVCLAWPSLSCPSTLPGRRRLACCPHLAIVTLPIVLAWPLAVVIFGHCDFWPLQLLAVVIFSHCDFWPL